MIEVENIDVSYENIQVIWDLSFRLSEDEDVVAIVGANGAGKSTLLRVLSGLHPVDSGTVTLWEDDIDRLSSASIVEKGFVHVSEGRNLFGDMTVEENLEMGAYTERDTLDETLREVYDLFPLLEERATQRAGTLSGGEQQMLAIGRGLMTRPRILALDEPSVGLAPKITEQLFHKIRRISENVTVLLVEQHVHDALSIAERACLLENGELVAEGSGQSLLESDHIARSYL